MLQVFLVLCFAFSVLRSYVAGETGCPPDEDILPCKCTRHPQPHLLCKNLLRLGDVRRVFEASKRYSYQQVRIADSLLLYLDAEIFDKAAIASLHLENTTVSTLTDTPVREIPHLRSVHLENTRVMRGFTSQNFTFFTNLEEIVVKSSPVRNIPSKYGDFLPKSLKRLTFYENGIKKIGLGAFAKHPDLQKLTVESNNLTQLTRAIFPRPFNVVALNFNSNRIASIPDDLFSDMPYLQSLNLQNNLISTIPEATFSGRERNLPYFSLEGNPLECDCRLLWIIKDKPEFLDGSCMYPAELKGRKLQDLKPSELSC